MTTKTFRFPLMLALASALAASPALAQKGGHGHSGGKDRQRVERRDDGRARTDRRGDDGQHRGWCQGKGNPHNTVENCGYGAGRRGTLTRRGTYDRSGTYDRQGTYGSGTYNAATYQQAHDAYHTQHDRECRALSSQHATDLQWLLRVRSQCKSEHEAWHQRYDPNRR